MRPSWRCASVQEVRLRVADDDGEALPAQLSSRVVARVANGERDLDRSGAPGRAKDHQKTTKRRATFRRRNFTFMKICSPRNTARRRRFDDRKRTHRAGMRRAPVRSTMRLRFGRAVGRGWRRSRLQARRSKTIAKDVQLFCTLLGSRTIYIFKMYLCSEAALSEPCGMVGPGRAHVCVCETGSVPTQNSKLSESFAAGAPAPLHRVPS